MKYYLLLLLMVFVLSCNQDDTQETLKMEDIIPTSERYKEGDSVQNRSTEIDSYDSLSAFAKMISDTLGVNRFSVFVPDSVLFPDRFLCRTKEKWQGKVDNVESLVSFWTYNDSLETKNALFNWLDCFGKRCSSLQLYEEKKLSNESFLIYATDRKMVYWSTVNSFVPKPMIEKLHRIFSKEKVLYVVTQGVGRKTEWWEFVDRKWGIKKRVQ